MDTKLLEIRNLLRAHNDILTREDHLALSAGLASEEDAARGITKPTPENADEFMARLKALLSERGISA